jgi:hypothetical protein
MKTNRLIRNLIPLLALVSTTAFAQYKYFPDSPLRMGVGYNPYMPNQAHNNCLKESEIGSELGDKGKVVYIEGDVSLIEKRKTLYEALNFDFAMSAKFALGRVGANVRLDESSMFQSNSLTWAIKFTADFGKFYFKKKELHPEFDKLSLFELYQKCGTEIIADGIRMGLVYALVTVNNLSESQKSALEGSLNFKYGNSDNNVTAKTKISKLSDKLATFKNVHVQFKAFGGEDLLDLSTKIKASGSLSVGDIEQIETVAIEYLGTINKDNAPYVTFFPTPIGKLAKNKVGWVDWLVGNKVSNKLFAEGEIKKMYDQYLTNESDLTRINKILVKGDMTKFNVNQETIKYLEKMRDFLIAEMKKIEAAAAICFDETKDCHSPVFKPRSIAWPGSNPSYYCHAAMVDAKNENLVSDELQAWLNKKGMGPKLTVDKTDPKKEVLKVTKFIRCDRYLTQ